MKTVTQIILTADEGRILTNGETYGITVVLPENADINEWHEITAEEYNEIQKAIDERYDFSEMTESEV